MPPKKRHRSTVAKRAVRSVPCAPDVTALRPARRLAIWDELPPALREQMCRSGVTCAADLAPLSPDVVRAIVGSDPRFDRQALQAWRAASGGRWRARDSELSQQIVLDGARDLMRRTAQGGTSTATVASTLGFHLPVGASGDVVPSVTLTALGSATRSGSDVFRICQQVVQSRVLLSVRPTTSLTYSSHLSSVSRFCSLLGVQAVPAHPLAVVLYAAVCGSGVTLRGHLAAWRRAHLVSGYVWPSVPQAMLQAVYRGTVAIQTPRLPRPGARLSLLQVMVPIAVENGQLLCAACSVLAYWFLLRVPSELLAQVRLSNTRCARGWGAALGVPPGLRIRRKNRPTGSTLARPCLCDRSLEVARLCPHLWLGLLQEKATQDLLLASYGYSTFLTELRGVLRQTATRHPAFAETIGDTGAWGSHVFRTGAARDLLAASGVAAARAAGEWDSNSGLTAYTSSDAVDSRRFVESLDQSASDEDENPCSSTSRPSESKRRLRAKTRVAT